MKIEKISDIQIKCTLNKQDLNDRELLLSELAYGSEKARALFSELLLQASYECGFEAQDVPLMIEAVPMSKDSLVLILTKVTDPEELNVNYSNISTPSSKSAGDKSASFVFGTRADDILKETEESKLFPSSDNTGEDPGKPDRFFEEFIKKLNNSLVKNIQRAYCFDSLSQVIRLSDVIAPVYNGVNTLYKITGSERYCLLITMSDETPEIFNKVCNICAEYGEAMHTRQVSSIYFDEHYETIIKNKAIQKLKLLSKH